MDSANDSLLGKNKKADILCLPLLLSWYRIEAISKNKKADILCLPFFIIMVQDLGNKLK